MLQYYYSARRVNPKPPDKDIVGTFILNKTDVNPNLTRLSAVVIEHEIYIYGGVNGSVTGRLVRYNPFSRVSTNLPPGAALYDAAVVEYNNKLYRFGGYTGSAVVNTAAMYDPLTNRWLTLTALPSPTRGAGIFVFNNKIYIVGGYDGRANVSSIVVFDPATNTYTTHPLPGNQRTYGAVSDTIDGLFYCAGGMNNSSTMGIYNPITNKWSKASNLPNPVAWGGCCVDKGGLFVYGGIDPNSLVATRNLYTFDPEIGNWVVLAQGPVNSAYFPLVHCYGRVFLVGPSIYEIQ